MLFHDLNLSDLQRAILVPNLFILKILSSQKRGGQEGYQSIRPAFLQNRRYFFEGTRLLFEFFRGSNDFIVQKVYFLRLMPVCFGLIMVSCLFLSVPPNYKWSIIEQG
jgi:hypothetical protein